eukprot:GILJ01008112.1.p1 GENE.GILJ01008112.1~~GILJ01008112.1.p1  ORF type:complete len:1472 (-),score=223.61 GILJ01008112.1:233-4648(-)
MSFIKPSRNSGNKKLMAAVTSCFNAAYADDSEIGENRLGIRYEKLPSAFTEDRHTSFAAGRDNDVKDTPTQVTEWRMKERMKTVSVGLVLCLNIGVDPPDIVKTSPCARMECWVDPIAVPPQKALELIGKQLQAQYERWQPKARLDFKTCLDPTVEDVKKLCLSLRRSATEERVLFHYNGHGVPRPTSNGEIWVFNKNYTQYIPLSVYDLQTWMGSPSIYIFDCSAAGQIVNSFNQFAEQREREAERSLAHGNPPPAHPHKECILLAACAANEILPMNPEFPADVFTACLTTPIKIALRWFCSRSMLSSVSAAMIDRIPGRLNDRKTPLGELNWIFTAITDTIAWNVLPRDLFQKLFRQDLLVASLFRNFLLAERIMRSVNCTPICKPELPPTHQHAMWQAWDLAAELCLSQLPTLLSNHNAEYRFSPFFTEQLTAFAVWLEFGSEQKKPPEQLPIVLQVLLSQTHRLRALVLLGQFLDMGPWAVNLALSVGIFPYVLKLLQSPAVELRQVLTFIWAKILALDRSCQSDLVKESGHIYFLSHLALANVPTDQRAMSAFAISVICRDHRPGQHACMTQGGIALCLLQLGESDPLLRRWACLALAEMCKGYAESRRMAFRESAPEKLLILLKDPRPEVRAAAVYALGTLMEAVDARVGGLPPITASPRPTSVGSVVSTPSNMSTVERERIPSSVGAAERERERINSIDRERNAGYVSPAVPPSQVAAAAATPQPHTSIHPGSHGIGQHTFGNQQGVPGSATAVIDGSRLMDCTIAEALTQALSDGSPLVRRELVVALSNLIRIELDNFHRIAKDLNEVEQRTRLGTPISINIANSQQSVSQPSSLSAHNTPKSSAPSSNNSPAKTVGMSQFAGGASNRLAYDPLVLSGAAAAHNLTPPSIAVLSAHSPLDGTSIENRDLAAAREKLLARLTPIWYVLVTLSRDPAPTVAKAALQVVEIVEHNGADRLSYRNGLSGSSLSQLAEDDLLGVGARSSNIDIGGSVASSSGAGKGDASTKRSKESTASRVMAGFFKKTGSFPNLAGLVKDETPRGMKKVSSALDFAQMNQRRAAQEEERRRAEQMYKPQWPSSEILDWSARYFSKPIAQATEVAVDDPLGPDTSHRLHRDRRNKAVIREAQNLLVPAPQKKFEDQIAILDNDTNVISLLMFHPFEPLLFVADEADGISVWNWEEGEKINTFGTRVESGSQITSMTLLNENERALLLTASDDGVVKIWKDPHKAAKQKMLSAFRALPMVQNSRTRGSGMVIDWQQANHVLVTAGNNHLMRIWDVERELAVLDIPTGSESCVTSLTSDQTSGQVLLGGCADGSLRLFDARVKGRYSLVHTITDHQNWVVHVHMQRGGDRQVISGSIAGDIKFWDLRTVSSLKTIDAHRSSMTALAVHDYAPILASGSQNQFIKVFNMAGESLSMIRYHDGFLGQRIGPISCLAFHRHRLLLAAGATDSIISIYAGDSKS